LRTARASSAAIADEAGRLARRRRTASDAAESAGLAAQLRIVAPCWRGAWRRQRRQPVSSPGPVALLISRLQLAARRGPRRIDETADLPADLTLQCAATRDRAVGPGHAGEVRSHRLDAGLGQSPLWRFGPVEGHAEKGAARTALLADADRLRDFLFFDGNQGSHAKRAGPINPAGSSCAGTPCSADRLRDS